MKRSLSILILSVLLAISIGTNAFLMHENRHQKLLIAQKSLPEIMLQEDTLSEVISNTSETLETKVSSDLIEGPDPEVIQERIYIRNNMVLDLYDQWTVEHLPSKPAFGNLANLNSYGFNFSEMNIKTVKCSVPYLTKITLEGYIPTWALTTDESDIDQITDVNYIVKYTIDDCSLYLTPEEDSIEVLNLQMGETVTVIAEYKDWYQVQSNYNHGSNAIHYGWIKKEYLSFYDCFNTNIGLMVNVKKGSYVESHGYEEPFLIDEVYPLGNIWGKIFEETEEYYKIGLPGAWMVKVNKSDVEPFSTEENPQKNYQY